jgi:hypothetical protein
LLFDWSKPRRKRRVILVFDSTEVLDMTIADWAPLVFGSAGVLALLLFFSLPEH